MKRLFDQGTPVPLKQFLAGHVVYTAYELGWSALKNGDLLSAAESNGFELLVTTDTSLRYQQNLTNRKIAIVVLSTTSWPRIKAAAPSILRLINSIKAGEFLELKIPNLSR